MKKLLSISYANWAFNLAMLVLRAGMGMLIIPFGYHKLVHFAEMKNNFLNFMSIGTTASLSLAIFAELFCGMLIVLGLLTRLAALPLVIMFCVVLAKVHHGDIFGKGQEAVLFLSGFLAILLCGPGRVSVDGVINK